MRKDGVFWLRCRLPLVRRVSAPFIAESMNRAANVESLRDVSTTGLARVPRNSGISMEFPCLSDYSCHARKTVYHIRASVNSVHVVRIRPSWKPLQQGVQVHKQSRLNVLRRVQPDSVCTPYHIKHGS